MRPLAVLSRTFLLTLSVGIAQAQGDAFFEHGDARDVFAPPIEIKDAETPIGYHPFEQRRREEEAARKLAEDEKRKKEREEQQKHSNKIDPLESVEDIEEYFGPADEDQSVLAVNDAPPPLQAMYHCLNIKNRDCAQKYAAKYKRYLDDLKTRNREIASLVQEGDARGEAPKSIAETMQSDLSKFPPGVQKQLLALMKEMSPDAAVNQKEKVLQDYRKQVRALNLPKDPKGELDILFLLDPTEEESRMMATQVSKMAKTFSGSEKIGLVSFYGGQPSKSDLNSFKRKFPAISIRNGQILIKELGVPALPAVLFRTRNSNQVHSVSGLQHSTMLEEIARAMTGSN